VSSFAVYLLAQYDCLLACAALMTALAVLVDSDRCTLQPAVGLEAVPDGDLIWMQLFSWCTPDVSANTSCTFAQQARCS
jgi:hypothetical protein